MWNAPPDLSSGLVPGSGLPTGFRTGQVSVTTNTVVVPANPQRIAITFQNDEAAGGDNIFIHPPGGSAVTGFKLFAGQGASIRLNTTAAINASTGGGGAHTLSYAEEYTL